MNGSVQRTIPNVMLPFRSMIPKSRSAAYYGSEYQVAHYAPPDILPSRSALWPAFFLQSVRITAGLFKEPAAVSEPLKFGSRLEKDTGVNGLSCGTSLDLTDMPADGTYDCRYLDGHGTLHRDATLVVDGTKAGLYNGQGKTMSAD